MKVPGAGSTGPLSPRRGGRATPARLGEQHSRCIPASRRGYPGSTFELCRKRHLVPADLLQELADERLVVPVLARLVLARVYFRSVKVRHAELVGFLQDLEAVLVLQGGAIKCRESHAPIALHGGHQALSAHRTHRHAGLFRGRHRWPVKNSFLKAPFLVRKDDESTRAGRFPAHSQVRPLASAHTVKDPPHSTCADRLQARFRSSPPRPLSPAYQAWRHYPTTCVLRHFRRRTRRGLLHAAPFPVCLPAGFLSRLSPCKPFPIP